MGLLKKIIGDGTNRRLNQMEKQADQIEKIGAQMVELTDEQLQAKTDEFRTRLDQGEKLDDLLPEAFAVVREAATRVLQMTPFRVQLIGAIVLHEGDIAEMKTGEGKTLVATMPIYLNALQGKGVHLVTVNEYLARIHSEMMGELYNFLGLSVGLNVSGLSKEDKREAYAADITYGTNNEFGFDYLRDNMVLYKEEMVMRDLHYVIVDEVDSILIDEARTPLIISGSAEKSTKLYMQADQFVQMVDEDDYTTDAKTKAVQLTEQGISKAERFFGIENLFDYDHVELNHHVQQAMKAHIIMHRDTDYVIDDGEIVIVDQFTGRLMKGRRYSEGLHQAIEAKENQEIQRESMTLATITFQNYFRRYDKLAGMTGTAKTEEEEFQNIYGMDVLQIPTNLPVIREDMADLIYKSQDGKFQAVADEIDRRHREGQPVLVGTVAVETSELVASLLKKRGVPHNVLNAKNHAKEAEIIENAGQKGAVTIATNMAGRGTDIKLGEGVTELGGLHIIGTERHESRRIDNQLRGRSGRQGDPGSTQFYLSLEDELMKRFGSERMQNMMGRLGMDDDQPIESKMVSRSVESAQRRVEGNNFDARKQVLQYDDVMREQREIIYKQRNDVLESENLRAIVEDMIHSTIERIVREYTPEEQVPEDWDLQGIINRANATFLDEGDVEEKDIKGKDPEEIIELLDKITQKKYDQKEAEMSPEHMREFEKVIVLHSVDSKWMDHIDAMDQLREGIHLRAYGQTDPLREYQFEGFEMFEDMVASIEEEVATYIMKAQVEENMQRQKVAEGEAVNPKEEEDGGQEKKKKPVVRSEKVGRNALCPCGSGKKYKHCHGQ